MADDDFASVKAPPSKRPREDVKQQEPKKPSSKSSSQETNSQPTLSQKSRWVFRLKTAYDQVTYHTQALGWVCLWLTGTHLTQVNSIIEPLTVVCYRITSWSHDESYLRWKCSTGKGWKCKFKLQWFVFFFFLHRRPSDEKLYERDLEAAITLSLLNNADGMNYQSPSSRGTLCVFNCVRFWGFFILNISFQFLQQMLWFSFLQIKTQILLRCTSRTAVWTVQFWVHFFFFCCCVTQFGQSCCEVVNLFIYC